ncbi:MAG: hypothetical protein HDR88_14425 [Bacteroides sp.]|nr:hypothetical protein [Bacteroides sp.]
MQKSLLTCGALLICSMPAFSSPETTVAKRVFRTFSPAKNILKGKTNNGLRSDKTIKMIKSKETESGKWQAQRETMYAWTGEWTLAEINDLTFNDAGQILTQLTSEYLDDEIEGYSRTLNTYDSNGMITERLIEASLDGENFIPSHLRVVAYDPIVTDLIVSNEQTLWSDGQEYVGNCYHFDITRNTEGNITLAERAVLFNGIFDPTERFTVEYGSDNKAASTLQSMLQYDWNTNEYYWQETTKFENIVWEETDGQIYSEDSMMGSRNKLKSATLYDFEEDMAFQLELSYTSDGYNLIMTTEELPQLISKLSVVYLPNDGYRMIMEEAYYGSVFLTIEEILECAANGLILREYYSENAVGEEPYIEETKGEFFGGTEEQPEAYEYSIYNPEEDVWVPSMRVEFADYTFITSDPDAIEAVSAPESAAEYYNLQGIRIQNPTKGSIYIERRGDQTRKVLMK